MRKNFGPKTWIYPMPVLIIGSYDSEGHANAMNAAWGGIYDYNQIIISLSSHKTTDNIRLNKEFTVSFATKKTVMASDYVGLVSANKEPNKINKAGLTPIKAENVNAPLFKEYPLTLECCLVNIINEGEGGGCIIADIVNVSADEEIISNNKIDVNKLEPIAFDPCNNKYLLVGEEVANAFSIGLKLK